MKKYKRGAFYRRKITYLYRD